MSEYNSKISYPEGALLNKLYDISPLEWRRFRVRYSRIDDQLVETTAPPFIAFRFENESRELISRLKALITEYQGMIKWELSEHKRENLPGTNWVIGPARYIEIEALANKKGISADEYFSTQEPKFSTIAFEDLNGLTAYIEQGLSDFKNNKL